MVTHSPLAPQPVDQLIDARWIIPIEPANTVLHHHSLAISGGRILELLPTTDAHGRYVAKHHFRLLGHVLIPGLVNLHTHAAMSLLRGYADDIPLMRWLREHIWPAEHRCVSPDFVHDGTLLASWEMLRGGVTCFNDMYFFPESAAEAALSAGIRAALGITIFEFPSVYGAGATDYLAKGLSVREKFSNHPLLSFCLAPHAPYTVANVTFEQIRNASHEHRLPIHIHIHETLDEIRGSLQEHGVRPLARLHQLGLLDPALIAVHAVHLEPDEVSLLAEQGCHVAHCPTSNMKLGSGTAPIATLLDAGVSVGIGTDGAASNNRLDLFRELGLAALLAKLTRHDAACLPAHQALEMATLAGAKALGIDHQIGSLQTGKQADLTAVDLTDWHLQPCYDPVSQLAYVTGRENVSHVWVNGKLRIEEKKPIDLDLDALQQKVKVWQNTIKLGS